MIELFLSPVRKDQFPVRVISKASKKVTQDESNGQEKRKKIRPSEEVFNQCVPQINDYDPEFE